MYFRVSTLDQSAEMQRDDLQAYCTQRGFTIYREYLDQGVSGGKERRPSLDQLMADARKRKFDMVLVWRFDRFARSTKHLVTSLEEFQHLSIDFISYQEDTDSSSPLGKAMFTIVAAISELERNIIVERIRGGLRRAKLMGKKIGRPGLQMDTERILELNTQGLSIRAIAKQVGASPSYVHKALQASREVMGV